MLQIQTATNPLEFLQQISWQQSHDVRRRVANILALLDLYKEKLIGDDEFNVIYELLHKETILLDETVKKICSKLNEYNHISDMVNVPANQAA